MANKDFEVHPRSYCLPSNKVARPSTLWQRRRGSVPDNVSARVCLLVCCASRRSSLRRIFPTPDNKIGRARYCLPFICSSTMDILPINQHLSWLHQFTGVVCSKDFLHFFFIILLWILLSSLSLESSQWNFVEHGFFLVKNSLLPFIRDSEIF